MREEGQSDVEVPAPAAGKRKGRVAVDSEEIEAENADIQPEIARSQRGKGKGRAGDVAAAVPIERATSGGSVVGSKRAQPTSPVQQVSSKRSRKSMRAEVAPLDLSGECFNEGSSIDLSLVPELRGKVSGLLLNRRFASNGPQACGYCADSLSRVCEPVWGLDKKTAVVRCWMCRKGKQRCSFTKDDQLVLVDPMTWNIAAMPEVRVTKDTLALRADKRVAKSRGVEVASVAMEKTVSEGSVVERPRRAKKAPARFQEVTVAEEDAGSISASEPKPQGPVPIGVPSSMIPVPSGPSGFFTSIGVSQGGSHRLLGRTEQVFFEDISRYEELLRDPSRSSVALNLAIAELIAVDTREQGHIAVLKTLADNRGEFLKRQIRRLEKEAEWLMTIEDEEARELGHSNVDEDRAPIAGPSRSRSTQSNKDAGEGGEENA